MLGGGGHEAESLETHRLLAEEGGTGCSFTCAARAKNCMKKSAEIVMRPPWFSAFAGGMALRSEQRLDLTLRMILLFSFACVLAFPKLPFDFESKLVVRIIKVY